MNLFAPHNSDGYKLGHADMYADGTSQVYSNLTPRTDKIYRRGCTRFYDGKLVWFGGQMAIHEVVEMWNNSFFSKTKDKAVARFKKRVDAYLGPEVISVKRLEALHDLGYLPLEIKTLDEGLKVPMGIPVLTITNTLAEQFWLVNYLETVLSNLTWKQATNATIAAEYKAILTHFAKETGCYDPFLISIQGHDFSCRGMSGPEDAARAGTAPLAVGFIGTDTLSAMDAVEDYYGCEGLLAISVPATEHAVSSNNILSIEKRLLEGGLPTDSRQLALVAQMRAAGEETRLIAEALFMLDLITRKYPKGIISYVADTYDFWAVLTRVLKYLKADILGREDDVNGLAKLVVRPDSGDPVKVVSGYKLFGTHFGDKGEFDSYLMNNGSMNFSGYEVVHVGDKYYELNANFMLDYMDELPEHEVKGAIEILWEIFGGTETSTGHKLLDRHIGLIYGDSITTQRAVDILQRLADKGFASMNVVFGVGSYTYQCNTRDTFGFAVKATYSVVDDEPINIFKDPKTDAKKKSAKGLLHVVRVDGELNLTDEVSPEAEQRGELITRFKDGKFVNQVTFDEIRERLA